MKICPFFQPVCPSLRSAVAFLFVMVAGLAETRAQTLVANFTSESTVPVVASSYTATGKTVELSLGYAPSPGTDLMVVKNTGVPFISGQFGNLQQGEVVGLYYDNVFYKFVANYFGGTGNDLVLHWLRRGVHAWGPNDLGQLGNSTTTSARTIQDVAATSGSALFGKNVISVAAGASFSLALCSDGSVAAWGSNSTGQLGINSTVRSSTPVQVVATGALSGKKVIAVSAGNSHSLALCTDGTVYAWGSNSEGQLGNTSLTNSLVPVAVTTSGVLSGKTVVAIAAGGSHSVALCASGELVTWGAGTSGQLGNNAAVNQSSPVLVDQTGTIAGKSVVSISAGSNHTTCLCSDGTVFAFGGNSSGQLGNNSAVSSSVPVQVVATGVLMGKTVVSLSSGSSHTLLLCSDGTAAGFGSNSDGQLGNGSTTTALVPVLVNASGVLAGKFIVSLCSGNAISFATTSDGSILSWGRNTFGALGNNSTTSSSVPVVVLRSGSQVNLRSRVASASTHALLVSSIPASSGLVRFRPVGSSISTLPAPAFSPSVKNYLIRVPNASPFIIYALAQDAARVRVNGNTIVPGNLTTGVPDQPTGAVITPRVGLNPITIEVNGDYGDTSIYTLMLVVGNSLDPTYSSAGDVPVVTEAVVFSGLNLTPSLGFAPEPGTRLTVVRNPGYSPTTGYFSNLPPGQILSLPYNGKTYRFAANYCGGSGNDLVLEWANQTVVSWGSNIFGQLGDGGVNSSLLPIDTDRSGVLAGKTVVSLTCASSNVFALCADGTLAAWGANSFGQLGIGAAASSLVPSNVTGLGSLSGKSVASVATGNVTGLAVCTDGSISAWGYNAYGQVGDGTTTNRNIPVNISTRGSLVGRKALAVAVGGLHSLALCTDGNVVSWGAGGSGQLGNGTFPFSYTEPPGLVFRSPSVLGTRRITAIGAGMHHSLALCEDGTLVSWGNHSSGQLGIGGSSGGDVPEPVLVKNTAALSGKSVIAISASSSNSAVLCSDGSIATWGDNAYGQLGIGTLVLSTEPKLVDRTGVLAGRTVTSISVGDGCMFATCSDGAVVGWGRNSYGQLGDGTLVNRSLPVLVNSTTGLYGKRAVVAVNGGGYGHTHAIVAGPDDGYIAWVSKTSGNFDRTDLADPDRDGFPNLMEYVLNGHPSTFSSTILPTISRSGNQSVFSFNRLASSTDDTTQIFQYSSDLVNWTDVRLTNPVGSGVNVGATDPNGVQSLNVTVPNGSGAGLFGRLRATRN